VGEAVAGSAEPLDLKGLVTPEAAERWRRARAGADLTRHLQIAFLEPGQVGVLDVQVRSVSSVRTYKRKRGGEGTMARVTLADETGEVDLVLWDDEVRHMQSGPFRRGQRLILQGPTVRPGYRSGVELSLGAASVRVVDAGEDGIAGVVVRIEGVRVLPDGRRTAQLLLDTPRGPAAVAVWQDVLDACQQVAPGSRLLLTAVVPHPSIPGNWLSTPRTVATVI
jgi:hypothetical protein